MGLISRVSSRTYRILKMLRLSQLKYSRKLVINRDAASNTTAISVTRNPEPKVKALPKISKDDHDIDPLRARGIEVSKHDVLLLSQFVRSNGTILSHEETNLSKRCYNKVVSCIKMAQREQLMPSGEPEYDFWGAPIPNFIYSNARFEVGTRVDNAQLSNRQTREQSWHLREPHYIRDPLVERDAPRVRQQWPRRTSIMPIRNYHDPRVRDENDEV